MGIEQKAGAAQLDGVAVRAALATRLEHADRQAGFLQVTGCGEAVDAAADDDDVVVFHENSSTVLK